MTKGRGTDIIGDMTELILEKCRTLVQKGSVPQQCGIILLKTLDILGEYSSTHSLGYSLSTRVANYSDSS